MWTSFSKWVGNISNHFHAILRPFGRVEKNAFLSDGVYCHKLGCNIILLKKYLGSSLRQRDFSRCRLNLENYFAFLPSSQKGKKLSVFTVQTIFCSIFVEKRGKSKISHFYTATEFQIIFLKTTCDKQDTGGPLLVRFLGPRKNRTNDNPYC